MKLYLKTSRIKLEGKISNSLDCIIHREVDRYNHEEIRGLGYSLN